MLPRNKVFGLQLFAGAGRKAHLKVWQAVIPRSGHAHLLGAVFGREFLDRMQISSSQLRPVEFGRRMRLLRFFDAALEPDFVDVSPPVGE